MGNTIWKSLKRIGKLKTIHNMNQQITSERGTMQDIPGLVTSNWMGSPTGYAVGYDAIPRAKREVVIIPLERGYNVKVGCTTVAFETIESLVAKLTEYLNDPAAAERKWNEGKFFENK